MYDSAIQMLLKINKKIKKTVFLINFIKVFIN